MDKNVSQDRKAPMSQEEIQSVFDALQQSSHSTSSQHDSKGFRLRAPVKPLTWVYLDNGTGHNPQ